MLWIVPPVFRIGGDEVVVILEGQDYENREALLSNLKDQSNKNVETKDGIVIVVGMAISRDKEDYIDVFRRVNRQMYSHKNKLKHKRPSLNLC